VIDLSPSSLGSLGLEFVCLKKTARPERGFIADSHRDSFGPADGAFAAPRLFHLWKREKSPAFHATLSPGILRLFSRGCRSPAGRAANYTADCCLTFAQVIEEKKLCLRRPDLNRSPSDQARRVLATEHIHVGSEVFQTADLSCKTQSESL
jgi:hypothetical protein